MGFGDGEFSTLLFLQLNHLVIPLKCWLALSGINLEIGVCVSM